jgi:hypothetical protein
VRDVSEPKAKGSSEELGPDPLEGACGDVTGPLLNATARFTPRFHALACCGVIAAAAATAAAPPPSTPAESSTFSVTKMLWPLCCARPS